MNALKNSLASLGTAASHESYPFPKPGKADFSNIGDGDTNAATMPLPKFDFRLLDLYQEVYESIEKLDARALIRNPTEAIETTLESARCRR